LSWCVKVDTLGRLCDNNLERSYNHFITINVYFIGAAYNSYFLIVYKPSTLIISPQTFSTQLGAGTAWFCLSQCAIPFCTLSAAPLYKIVKKGVLFEWGPIQQKAQQDLKILIEDCFHTRNPKFPSEQPLVLAVDTS